MLFRSEWSGLTGALAAGYSVYHNNDYWVSLIPIADITLSEPSGTNTDWLQKGYTDFLTVISLGAYINITGQ